MTSLINFTRFNLGTDAAIHQAVVGGKVIAERQDSAKRVEVK
jgi:hypothetical protein